MDFMSKMSSKLGDKSNEASLAAAGLVGVVGFIQFGTDMNPIGRCFTFWKQLRVHVRILFVWDVSF